jgi:hypothetical protein
LLVAVALLTGCATLDSGECRSAYDVGFRDAIFGLQRQDDLYAPLCQRQGVQLDVARYAQGWQEGLYEFERRKMQGGTD